MVSQLMVQEWEGRLNIGMSNSVTTAIRESVRDMAIGKTKTTEKADRATVEQVQISYIYSKFPLFFFLNFFFMKRKKMVKYVVFQAIDPRTRMVLFKMLNRGVFHDINGCISTGKEVLVFHQCFFNSVHEHVIDIDMICSNGRAVMMFECVTMCFHRLICELLFLLLCRQTCIMQQNLMVRNWQSKCTKLRFWFLSKSINILTC